jgi:hypothetical protein
MIWSRDSVVGIATSYSLDYRGLRVRVPVGSNFLHFVETGSGVHQTSSYSVGMGGALSQRLKRPRRVADHLPPASAKAKKMWVYTSTPPYAFMA